MDTIKCNMPTLKKQKQYLTFWWSQYGCIHWMNRFLYAWRATNRFTGELVEKNDQFIDVSSRLKRLGSSQCLIWPIFSIQKA